MPTKEEYDCAVLFGRRLTTLSVLLRRKGSSAGISSDILAKLDKIASHVKIGARAHPTALVDSVGPYLMRYRDQITSEYFSDFVKSDFTASTEEEVRRHRSFEGNTVSLDEVSDFVNIVRTIQELWELCSGPEQTKIRDIVRELLGLYAAILRERPLLQ